MQNKLYDHTISSMNYKGRYLIYLNTQTQSMFAIGQDGLEEEIEPPLSATSFHRDAKQEIEISNDNETKVQTDNEPASTKVKDDSLLTPIPSGCTKFFKLDYYKQFFNVGEPEVISRLKASITIPPTQDFIERSDKKPDLYGPFWIMSTLILLLGIVGNLANYLLSKFSYDIVWNSYFFRLEYIRYAICFVFPFGFGVPAGLFFLLKFISKDLKLMLSETICIYGYSLTIFLPALTLCILPLSILQWILIISAGGLSFYFLFQNMKNHVQGLSLLILGGILVGLQLIFALVLKLTFLGLLE